MNLLYLLGALAGVGLIVGLNLLLLGRGQVRVDVANAAALMASEQPGFRAGRSIVSATGDAVLLEDVSGRLFLVVGAGDKLVNRLLTAESLRAVSRRGETLDLRFRDPTFSRARFGFGDEATAREFEARLQGRLQTGA